MVRFYNIRYDKEFIYSSAIDMSSGYREDNIKTSIYDDRTNLKCTQDNFDIYRAQWNLAFELIKRKKLNVEETISWG